MPARLLTLISAVLAALLVAGAPALASVADEVSAGQMVAAELQRGTASCQSLSAGRIEALGEYVMERMVGSRAAHEAMNERMTQAIGAENDDLMHELMGRGLAGCTAGDSASGVPMGLGMMGGTGGGGWGAMMSSSAWGWMHNGTWQHMSPGQWRSLAGTMMGARYSAPGHHGWSTAGVLTVALGGLLLAALLALLALRRPWHRRRPLTPGAAGSSD